MQNINGPFIISYLGKISLSVFNLMGVWAVLLLIICIIKPCAVAEILKRQKVHWTLPDHRIMTMQEIRTGMEPMLGKASRYLMVFLLTMTIMVISLTLKTFNLLPTQQPPRSRIM